MVVRGFNSFSFKEVVMNNILGFVGNSKRLSIIRKTRFKAFWYY